MGSASCAKLIVFVFNILFFLFGAASVALGVWVSLGRTELFRVANLIDAGISESSNREQIDAVANQSGLIVIAAYVLIAIGVFTLIVGFFGCCGAMKESPFLLNVYALLVGLVLGIQIAAAVMAGLFRSKISSQAENALFKLQNKFYVALPAYMANSSSSKAAVTYLINFMQTSLECCGARELGDFDNSTSWMASNRVLNNRTIQTPITCCKFRDAEAKNAVLKPSFSWNSTLDYLADNQCPFRSFEGNANVNSQTCFKALNNMVNQYAITIIAVCITIAVIEILGILSACCLVRSLSD